jgi:DNA-directed RNA polymerase specialized sigma24 family protein
MRNSFIRPLLCSAGASKGFPLNSQTQVHDDAISKEHLTDREVLEGWRRERRANSLRPLLERYGDFVYSSACRRTGDLEAAAEVTRAVLLVLARRAHRLRNVVLAGWLFQVTALASHRRIGRLRRLWHWISRRTRPSEPPVVGSSWKRVAPKIDRALERLSSRQRNAILLCSFLNHEAASAARILRTREWRIHKRLQRGMKRVTKRLHRPGAPVVSADLLSECATEGCSAMLPKPLLAEILQAIDERRRKRPLLKLARRTLRSLAWARWRRRCLFSASVFGVLLAIAGAVIWYGSPTGRTWVFAESQMWGTWYWNLAMAEPARPWPINSATPQFDARLIRDADQFYRTTNIWPVHLTFTRQQWKALEPKHISPLANFILPDNRILLRNPEARRSGILGVLGYEYDWSQADCEVGQVSFANVATRVKGNIASLWHKRPFKLDLNKIKRGQKLGGVHKLTFDNLVFDNSCMSEALAYEFFRDAGVPSPRTAYAWLSVSVAKQPRPMGLYLMEEAVDDAFAAERFGSRKTPLFKPSTYQLFEYMGDAWSAYAPIYDLKTEATPKQRQRIIDFARLVTSASDQEFAERVGGFLDLDEFARFLAVEVLLPNYDSILTTGQNFYLYLDQASNKFGFIPWDLDAAWGNFWIGTKAQQQQSSIWRPWVGENRFLDRVMAVEEFRRVYRAHLEEFLARLYVPERLNQRIDTIAAAIRDPIAAESTYRLEKFEQTVGLKPIEPRRGWQLGINYPVPFRDVMPANDLKQFIAGRARSVHRQLAGESPGIILKHPKIW